MSFQHAIASYRFLLGFIVLLAVVIQFLVYNSKPNFNQLNFFSYFTILSNILVGIVFLLSSFRVWDLSTDSFARGMATLYILITGLGFIFLLGAKNGSFLWWVNLVLHYVSPVLVVLDWIFTPSTKISFSASLIWILLIVVYLMYTMIRGYFTAWYPYNFLNPNVIGGFAVVVYICVLTVVVLVLDRLVVNY